MCAGFHTEFGGLEGRTPKFVLTSKGYIAQNNWGGGGGLGKH